MDYNRPRRRVEKTSWHLPPAGPPAVTGAGPRPPPGRGSLRRLDTSTLPRRIQSKGGPRPVKLTHDLSTGASGIKGSNLPEGQQIQSVRKILASGDRENGEKSIGCWGGGRGGQGEGFRRGRALPLSASSASSAPRGAGGCAAGGDRRVPAREAEGRRHATGHAGTSVPLHAGARGGLPQPAEAQPHSPRPRHQEGVRRVVRAGVALRRGAELRVVSDALAGRVRLLLSRRRRRRRPFAAPLPDPSPALAAPPLRRPSAAAAAAPPLVTPPRPRLRAPSPPQNKELYPPLRALQT